MLIVCGSASFFAFRWWHAQQSSVGVFACMPTPEAGQERASFAYWPAQSQLRTGSACCGCYAQLAYMPKMAHMEKQERLSSKREVASFTSLNLITGKATNKRSAFIRLCRPFCVPNSCDISGRSTCVPVFVRPSMPKDRPSSILLR